jgi:excisionase family DNA binding protein
MPQTPAVDDRDPQEWLTVEQVSKELSVHPVTVRDWLNRGLLAGSKAGRRRWRVRRQALEEFLARDDSSSGERSSTPADPYAPPTSFTGGVIDTHGARGGSS